MLRIFATLIIFVTVSFLVTARAIPHPEKYLSLFSPPYELSSVQKANLYQCIDRYISAFKNKDYRYIIKQLYPPIFDNFVAQNPGYSVNELIEKVSNEFRADMSTMELKGIKMSNFKFDRNYSSVLLVKGILYTTFQYSTTMTHKGKSYIQLKKIIAVSNNKGVKWFLTDATDQSRAILKEKLSETDYDFLSL